MRNVLRKETRLSASVLSYLFILFGLTFFLPGYPVLIGVFFVTLGIFQSFQTAREANDVVFSVLLPIAKRDVVKGKYAFVCLIECAALLLMALAVVLRMTVFAQSAVYRANALMNANFFALGTACLIFGLFNWIFVGGFFKTAYRFARPFVTYLIVAFLVILIAEALHHVPGLEALNAFGTDGLGLQLGLLAGGLAGFLLITVLSCKRACARFEAIDL
ncbi:MAG: ABC-2 transporter permease [Oscillospiraceae bacterium]|nr:ABC-2 transporter permease [Oscillospiraceae bacterium]